MQIKKEVSVIDLSGVRYLTIPQEVRKAVSTPLPKKFDALFTISDDTKKLISIIIEDIQPKETPPPSPPEKT